MPAPSQNAVLTWHPPVHLLPAEILSIIFLLVVEDEYDKNRVHLTLVCRRWYATMLSTPGIPSGLRIHKSSTVEMVRAAIQRTRWLLNVSIGQDVNTGAFDACFLAAIEAASRWQSLRIYSLPQSQKYTTSQIVQPLKNLESFHLEQDCDSGGFFEALMTAIATTATPRLTNMTLRSLNAVLYLVQPDCLHVFCSLTNLTIRLSKRMESAANILPNLQRLEHFEARHLHLPLYPSEAPLPLIQTLSDLSLNSVSIQWMAGRVFPVLRNCTIIFPHQIDAIFFQRVTMPACTFLDYKFNYVDPLRYFHDLPLDYLRVISGEWNVTRGNRQLVSICHMIARCAQIMTGLDLEVRCSGQLLTYMLSLLPALKALRLRLASPRALSDAFFQAFVATKLTADGPCEIGTRSRPPLCLKLEELDIYYGRWLRGPERTALLLVFGDIVSSRRSEGDFSLWLSFKGGLEQWIVERHVKSILHDFAYYPVIGISSPHGIIPLGKVAHLFPSTGFPFKEAEYLLARQELSNGCLSDLHHLVELRLLGNGKILPSESPPTLPLFHTLTVLEARNIHVSFLAGQTFHKLERCRMSFHGEGIKLSQDQVTQMPVCTKLDVDDLALLATLKLPQICELCVSFQHPEFDMIWDKHIAVNANLLRLELLHVYAWYRQEDLIHALGYLPVLKSLILGNGSCLNADFFGEFVPTHPNGTAIVKQSSEEGQKYVVLCPMLTSFLVEEFDSTDQLELIPVLNNIVTLRRVGGSPLRRFSLFDFALRRRFELIGSHGRFIVKNVALGRDAKSFGLNI